MDGSGFTVDTDLLRDAATALRLVADDVPQQSLVPQRDAYGHAGLVQAAGRFAETWEHAANVLGTDLERYSGTLVECATAYDGADERTQKFGLSFLCEAPVMG